MNINIVEERLDKLIKDCELNPKMFFKNDADFVGSYSYFMYLKFGIEISEIKKVLKKYTNINPSGYFSVECACFNQPDFQKNIKMFRTELNNWIFK